MIVKIASRRPALPWAWLLFVSALFLSSCASAPRPEPEPPEGRWQGGRRVRVEEGILSGSRPQKGLLSWLGVPYAEPPEGELRWRAPRKHHPWGGARPARKEGGMAVQRMPLAGRPIGTEDCLHLNLWRPDDRRTDLPVFVWIHGGANSSGSAAPTGDYSGANMARERGILFVSLNYRLGPLGWLMDGDLAPDAPGGNLGLLDILAALRWIKANAASFGGDPDNVTIAGESAGAANILGLLLCAQAEGLFSRALVQSPLDLFSSPARARKESFLVLCRVLVAARRAKDMGEAAGILDAMAPEEKASFFRSRPASEFLLGLSPDAMGMYDWPSLVLDGKLLPEAGLSAFATGDQPVKVPLIMGYNRDEVGVFLFLSGILPTSTAGYYRTMAWGSAAWGAWVEELARKIASEAGQGPTRLYRFDWGSTDASGKSPLPGYFGSRVGAFHALEIPFFLGNDTVAGRVLTGLLFNPWNDAGRKALSSAMGSYLEAFIRGDEELAGSGLPPWPSLPQEAGIEGTKSPIGLRFGGNALEAEVLPLEGQSAAERLRTLKTEIDADDLKEMADLLPPYLHPTLLAM